MRKNRSVANIPTQNARNWRSHRDCKRPGAVIRVQLAAVCVCSAYLRDEVVAFFRTRLRIVWTRQCFFFVWPWPTAWIARGPFCLVRFPLIFYNGFQRHLAGRWLKGKYLNLQKLCRNSIAMRHELKCSEFIPWSSVYGGINCIKICRLFETRYKVQRTYETQRLQDLSVISWTPWLSVRKRTIPTERPPLVGEF
jgi:hypothetical protein